MRQVDRELDRYLTLLRNKIREQGYIQLEVQETLGWGRSYISQLLTRQKNLRLDQVLMILQVIGNRPEDFFAELYGPGPGGRSEGSARRLQDDPLRQEIERCKALLEVLVGMLVERGIVASSDLRAAAEAAAGEVEEA